MSRTVLYDLPHDVRGFVKEDADGEAIFILNSRLTREANIKTLLHEQEHINNNDFDGYCSVGEVESRRHE